MSEKAALSRLATRVRLMVARAVLQLVNDATRFQSAQVEMQAGVVRDQVEHFQPYGFTSVAHAGAEGLALSVGGSTDHTVLICVGDRRYRLLGLESGEVALYDSQGQFVKLGLDGQIHIKALAELTLEAPQIHLVGVVDNNGTDIGEDHVHGGIEPGGGTTTGPE